MKTGKFGPESEVFSVGVVLIELLVGRVSSDVAPGGLYDYYVNTMEQEEELTEAALDARAGEWPAEAAVRLIRLALDCTGPYKKRPHHGMADVLRRARAVETE